VGVLSPDNPATIGQSDLSSAHIETVFLCACS